MTDLRSEDISAAILEMRDLLRLLAEPAVAQRDQTRREELRRIVGNSRPKSTAVLLMDGTRDQTTIHKTSGIQRSNLSVLVKQLGEAGLLIPASKEPKLIIYLLPDFFEEKN